MRPSVSRGNECSNNSLLFHWREDYGENLIYYMVKKYLWPQQTINYKNFFFLIQHKRFCFFLFHFHRCTLDIRVASLRMRFREERKNSFACTKTALLLVFSNFFYDAINWYHLWLFRFYYSLYILVYGNLFIFFWNSGNWKQFVAVCLQVGLILDWFLKLKDFSLLTS